MDYVQRCIICPADYAPLARSLCEGLAGEAGAGMLTTALSATGQGPATHFISAGMIEDTFASLLPLGSTPGQPETIVALSGGSVALDQINALLAAVDVSEQDPFAAMVRLNLTLLEIY